MNEFIKILPGKLKKEDGTQTNLVDALGLDVAPITERNDGYKRPEIAAVQIGENQYALSDILEAMAGKMTKYDDGMDVIRVTSAATTMGNIADTLTAVNAAGDHVLFDVSALDAGMYLCTIYIGDGYYRIADMVTGYEGTGFYSDSDLLADIIAGSGSGGQNHYTVQWDKTNAQCVRLNASAGFTTTTTNFGHFGSVNTNYNNPFDDIYPWSGRKLCNISLDAYMALQQGDSIKDCVTAWEDDPDFDYEDADGVWVYTPPFYGRTYEIGNYRYFDVSAERTQNSIYYPEQITARWHGIDETRTIGGASKHVLLPKPGIPAQNITLANLHTYAKNYGGSLTDIYTLDASTLLLIVEFATLNTQTACGNGADSVYLQSSFHPSAAATGSNTITMTGLSAAQLGNIVVGAQVDLGTSDGGSQTARTYVTAVATESGTTTITLAQAVTVTTETFVSIHGVVNAKDEAIGSKSGYIGANSRVNAYYRGEVLWANRWQYILGAYRHTGDGHIWICDREHTDDYDALDTDAHVDTRLALPESDGYVKALGMADGLCIPPFCTADGSGASSSNPVGDYCYRPALTTGNTILLFGGRAGNGAYCGAFCGYWGYTSGDSYWTYGARPRLLNP